MSNRDIRRISKGYGSIQSKEIPPFVTTDIFSHTPTHKECM